MKKIWIITFVILIFFAIGGFYLHHLHQKKRQVGREFAQHRITELIQTRLDKEEQDQPRQPSDHSQWAESIQPEINSTHSIGQKAAIETRTSTTTMNKRSLKSTN